MSDANFMKAVQAAYKKDGVSMTGVYQACEYCLENSGETNSLYIKDNEEHDEGIWICRDCETAAEVNYHSVRSCPCMCRDDSQCVYATSAQAHD